MYEQFNKYINILRIMPLRKRNSLTTHLGINEGMFKIAFLFSFANMWNLLKNCMCVWVGARMHACTHTNTHIYKNITIF